MTDRYTLTAEQAIEAAAKIAENYRPQGDPIGLHPQIIAGKIRELARSEGTATPEQCPECLSLKLDGSGESSTIGLTTCPVCDRSVDASGIEDTKAVKIGDSWYHGPCSRYAKRGESSTTWPPTLKIGDCMNDNERKALANMTAKVADEMQEVRIKRAAKRIKEQMPSSKGSDCLDEPGIANIIREAVNPLGESSTTPATPTEMCRATDRDFKCTLDKRHSGAHEAWGLCGISHSWPSDPVSSINEVTPCTNVTTAEPSTKQSSSSPAEITGTTSAKNAEPNSIPCRTKRNEELAVYLARELYDRFVMGGWEPQNAHQLIIDALNAPEVTPKKFKPYAERLLEQREGQ